MPVPDTKEGPSELVVVTTRKMRLYRMYPDRPVEELLSSKIMEDAEDRYEVSQVVISDLPATLVAGESEETPVEWTEVISSLAAVDLGFTSTTASAAVFVAVDRTMYALTFGQGWRFLRESQVDRQFGLDMAVRTLDPDEITDITRRALSVKARVDRNSVPGGQGLWAFGVREHAELVRSLRGKVGKEISVDLTHTRRMGRRRNFRLGLDCSDGLLVSLAVNPDSLIGDLREINRIVAECPVHSRLEPLLWIRRLPQALELSGDLDLVAVNLLVDPDPHQGEVGIAYPQRYYDGPDVARYVGTVGDLSIDTDELTIDHLRTAVKDRQPDDRVRTLRAGSIEGIDDSGQEVGIEVSARHWMTAEVFDTESRYIMIDGDWYQLGEEYVAHVAAKVAEAFANKPEWSLPAWRTAPSDPKGAIHEKSYNAHVASTDGRFLCLDRKLVRTRVHPLGFEACDLLGPANELVHVKKFSSQTGSSVLSHLFAQGLVAAESLTDRRTWEQFRELVGEQDAQRADALGHRPAGLVYAIHRSDKLLEPGSLFTFARSALVSASMMLEAHGIPLQIAVIR